MKTWLTISVALNLILATAWYYTSSRATQQAGRAAENLVQIITNTPPKPNFAQMGKPTGTNRTEKAKHASKFDWNRVESADYREYIANLRSIGCPEETIRDIIKADVNKLFAARKKERRAQNTNRFEFWKSGQMIPGMFNPEQMQQNKELAAEKKALLQELLGVDVSDPADDLAGLNPMADMFDFLPDDKQAAVTKVIQDFQGKTMEAMKDGFGDGDGLKKMQAMQKELEAELGKVLTPQELEDYQLRMSQTAVMMRMQLTGFEPNEQEFRGIFQLQKAYDDQYGLGGMFSQDGTAEEKAKAKAAKEELQAEIQKQLGDDRYAEYTRAQDYRYQNLLRITKKEGIDRNTANDAYAVDKLSRDQIQDLRKNPELDPVRRQEAIDAIQQETRTTLQKILGEKAYTSFTNRGW